MTIELPPLPFAKDALEPHISARTFDYHHGKHHKAYVDKTNALIKGTPLETKPLEAIVKQAKADSNTALFNNAAQAWNHSFFWQCLSPKGGKPSGDLAERIDADFGSFDAFKPKFVEAATGNFGSGWTWLCESDGKLSILNTDDAETPLTHPRATPLFVVDVWEHAYYLDKQNDRKAYVEAILDNCANWDFAAKNLGKAGEVREAA